MRRHVTPLNGSGDVPAWWGPLFELTGCTSVFLSVAWMKTWLEVYASDFECEWGHWEVDGQVVGGCLVLARVNHVRGFPLRSVFFNLTGIASTPTPFAEYNDVLHLPGYKDAIAEDLSRWLMSKPWSRCLLSGYEDGGVCAALALLLPTARVEKETRVAPYVDMSRLGVGAFETTLTGGTGTRVRKNRRRYEERLGPVTVRPAANVDEALLFFGEMTRLHLARWNAKQEATTLSAPRIIDFHRRLIRRLWENGSVEVVRVGAVGGAAIGYLYNFVMAGKVLFFQSGFDYESEKSQSPGLIAHTLAIEHYRRRGLREYDFLAGDAQYKRSLSNEHRDLHWSVLYRDQIWARAFLLGRRAFSRFLAKGADPATD